MKKQNRTKKENFRELKQEAGIIVLSVIVAVLLVKSGAIEQFITLTKDAYLIGSFIAGIFFTSAFTLPLSTVALVEIAQNSGHPVMVSIVGAMGGVVGDLILFFFIRDNLGKNLETLIKTSKLKRWSSIFHLKFFRYLTPLIGALIIASPLPDELGLAMMGFSRMRTSLLIPISYSMNLLGILAVISLLHF